MKNCISRRSFLKAAGILGAAGALAACGGSPAQVILRWHIQEGFSVIPGASNPDYIRENIKIFDFELTDEEMKQMRSLNKEKRFFNMSLKDKERIYLGNSQLPQNKF